MIKHFAADGTVKREWPDGLHASTPFERFGKQFVEVVKSNAIEMIEVADGEQVGETFVAAIASSLDVHPIEAALSAMPAADLPPVAISPEPNHAPLPSEVVETAAHALNDAAEVLKQEEARNASETGAQ